MIATLQDGSRIAIRPIEPEDRAALAEGFERLSPESRYRRFFGPIAHLSERDLDYLTLVDHHDHEALVATDADRGDGVAVARYIRTGERAAEAAIVVADDWQGRGVATVLMQALADRARAEGITRFEAPVLAYNREAIRLLERMGRSTRRVEGREVAMTVELPEPPDAPTVWRELLAQFALGALEPARTMLELLWPRRRGRPGDDRRNLIVVGTNGTGHAQAAVQAAAELAATSNATVSVVGAYTFLSSQRSEHAAAVTDAVQALRQRGLNADEYLRRGDPALVLADIAFEQSARLLVVGAGDRATTARRNIGNVAESVALRSPCDVLIVRSPEAQPSAPPAD